MSQTRSWQLAAYLVLAEKLNPLWRWVLSKRLASGKETTQSIAQKLMTGPIAKNNRPVVWGHAVGLGESLALAGLFTRLSQELPDHQFLITSTAKSATQVLHANRLGQHIHHQCAPIDTPQVVDAFLDYWRPVIAIWCEMDLWPALIAGTAQRRIPMALVNARLSPASLAQKRWIAALYRPLLTSFNLIYTQNNFSKQSLIDLGARPSQCLIAGSIKILGQPLSADPAQLLQWQAALAQRMVWVFASSHEGEEPLAYAVHQRLLRFYPAALLIIAPRYPKRGTAIFDASRTQGFVSQLRSTSTALDQATQIYVADTIGEMGLWYRLAKVVMMGGSYCAVEGHNPYEPIVLGAQVIYGPRIANFSESYEDLSSQGLALLQTEIKQIAQTIESAWQSNENSSVKAAAPLTQATPTMAPSPSIQSMLNTLADTIKQSTLARCDPQFNNTNDNTRPLI